MGKKRRGKASQEHVQRWHAIQRARERHGWHMTREEYEAVCDLIRDQSEDAHYLGKYSNTRVLYEVRYQGQTYQVVYDKGRQQICTFLPAKREER